MDNLLKTQSLEAFYGDAQALFGIDFELNKGELVAIMDSGETTLRAGDVLIQRGTNHAWANRSGQAARVAFILVDGKA